MDHDTILAGSLCRVKRFVRHADKLETIEQGIIKGCQADTYRDRLMLPRLTGHTIH